MKIVAGEISWKPGHRRCNTNTGKRHLLCPIMSNPAILDSLSSSSSTLRPLSQAFAAASFANDLLFS